ncbi:MAG: alpha/beta fold hydrolase [Candidatus Hodarchaeota archaeon]
MGFVSLPDGNQMYYIEKGKGPVVVFQHGFLGSSWLFEAEVDYFGRQGYHAFAFDMKGHGQSDKPEDSSYLLPDLAKDLDSALKQVIGEKKIVLLGHSMGGMIALCYATDPKISKRLRGLILEATARKLQNPALTQYIEGLRQGIIQVTNRPDIENILVHLCYDRAFQDAHPEVVKEFVDRTLKNENFVGLATMEAVVENYDVSDKLGTITIPTLLIHSENDSFIPFASSQELDEALPNSRHVPFTGPIGHMLQHEDPKKYKSTIEVFLKEIYG